MKSADARDFCDCADRLCSVRAISSIAASQRFRDLMRGEEIRYEREAMKPAQSVLCILLEGALGVCAAFEDGRRQVVDIELAGGVLTPPEYDDFTVEALSEARICLVEFDAEAMLVNPAAQRLLLALTQRRLARRSAHIAALGRLDGMERMNLFLADVARRVGRRRGDALHVSLPLSRDDIADFLGLNAETVSRLFSRVKKSGLAVFTTPTEFVVPDLEALERRTPLKPVAPRQLAALRCPPSPLGLEAARSTA